MGKLAEVFGQPKEDGQISVQLDDKIPDDKMMPQSECER